MPYVPGRKADVFISHAHVDNQELAGRRWVSDFADALKKRLDQDLGDKVDVWMDHQIDGSAPLTTQLIESIDAAATLVCVVSVGYIKSKWCELEWTQFLKRRQQQPGAGRVYFVFIRDIGRETLPEAIQALDLPGYEFWAVDPENKLDYTIGGPGDPSGSPDARIHHQLQKRLIRDMTKELLRLHAGSLAPEPTPTAVSAILSPAPPLPAASASAPGALSRELAGQCIFLAEVTDDLDDQRDGVRSYLEQRSATVVPAQWYANRDPEAYAAAMRADLARASAFVQLLGPRRGREKSQALPLGLPGLQHQLALQAQRPTFRWRSVSDLAEVGAEDWRTFLEAADIDACPIETFKTQLLRRLTPPPPPPPQLSGGTVADGLMVFVNSGRDDASIANSLRDDLGALQVTAYVPFWEQSLKDYNAEWRKLLKRCHGVIHVCGKTGVKWVRHQLLESDRVLALRQSRVRGKALGDAAWCGQPEPQLGVKLPDFHIIDCTSGVVDQQALGKFVNSLRP